MVGTVQLLVVMAGIVWRGRWQSWYSFTLYLVLVIVNSTIVLADPSLWAPGPWMFYLTAVGVMRFAVAIELALRVFRRFPGARATLGPVLLFVLVVTLVLVVNHTPAQADYATFLREFEPRLLNGQLWLYTWIAGLILWYRLPIAAFHKEALLPYVPYLLFQVVYLHAFVERSWTIPAVGWINQAAYLVTAHFWMRAAWRVDVSAPSDPDDRQPASRTHTLSHILSSS